MVLGCKQKQSIISTEKSHNHLEKLRGEKNSEMRIYGQEGFSSRTEESASLSVCLSLPLSLSLTHTHTHTHIDMHTHPHAERDLLPPQPDHGPNTSWTGHVIKSQVLPMWAILLKCVFCYLFICVLFICFCFREVA